MTESFLDTHPGLTPYVLSNVQLTGTTVGCGAYGSVEEVTVPLCGAAKRVHNVLLGSSKISTQFAEELQLMSTLHHPNIVQFLGVCFFPDTLLPALIMERLLTSLHDLLDPETNDDQPPPTEPEPLSFFKVGLKYSVLHNVASGLAYLHERRPPIIHRDLSAKNVLLTSQLVAKIADLGVARIMPHMRDAAAMTKAPGASVYMPPEAVAPCLSNAQKSKYNASIDLFSFGVVTIFTLGEKFPCDLLAPTYFDENKGTVIGRTELQRRSEYMINVKTQLRASGQLCKDHPLIQLIEQCLHNSPCKRPNIHEVQSLLEDIKAGIRDEESERNKVELVQALQNQPRNQNQAKIIDDLVMENAELQQQLKSSEGERKILRQQVSMYEAELTRAKETIERDHQQIQEMRQRAYKYIYKQESKKDEYRDLSQAQHYLRQQREPRNDQDQHGKLQSSEVVVADTRDLQQRSDSVSKTLRPKTPLYVETTLLSIKYNTNFQTTRQLVTQCRKKKKAPCVMKRGSATSFRQFAYIMSHGSPSVHRYEWSTEKWDQLPSSPYFNCGLVVIDDKLTTVGGWDGSHYTNKLFTLRQGQWVEHYPPMNIARSSTAAVSASDDDMVVIGGWGGDGWTAIVELFHVKSKLWYELTSLPEALYRPSATTSGNKLHVIGGNGGGYSGSLQDLSSSGRPEVVWTPLPHQPVKWSTAATLCRELVILGGEQGMSSVTSIHQLVDGQWLKIGSMSTGRMRCIVVCPSPDKMMIVGGCRGDSVEECAVV